MKQTEIFPLLNNNDLSLASTGVWIDDTGLEFAYSDGDTAENSLRQVLLGAKDRSSLSLELESEIYDWISEYHLSSERANIYRFLNLETLRSCHCLELGAGCGAITRYLGEQEIVLDAVEGNGRRAEICKLRCEDLDNVNVVNANFNNLTLPEASYDAVFLNGVLEYAARFSPGNNDDRSALLDILTKSASTLCDDGLLFVAIENRMGLKYWLGAKEDHYGKAYKGLYGYPASQGIKTYDRGEWSSILSDLSGDFCHRFIYPFPDYKMARAVFADSFIANYPFAYSNLYRMSSTDSGQSLSGNLHEFLLWKSLQDAGHFQEYANSFFIILSKSRERIDKVCTHDFMHFSGRGRKPNFRTITSKRQGLPTVEKKCSIKEVSGRSTFLQHDLGDAEYFSGPLLVSNWLHAALEDDETVFEQCIKDYYGFLQNYWLKDPNNDDAFDLLPFNIVVAESGEWQIIDKEWRLTLKLSPEFLLFRALLWFPAGNDAILENIFEKFKLSSLQDFIAYGFNLLSLSLDEQLSDFIALEERVQAEIETQIRSHPIKSKLMEPLKRSSESCRADTFLAQLYWAEENEQWSEDKSVLASGRIGSDSQIISFKLPPPSKGFTRLRLDPADRGGFFRIHKLTLSAEKVESSGEQERISWSIRGVSAIADNSKLTSIHYCKNSLGELFFSVGDDPFIVFGLPERFLAGVELGALIVEVQMDWPKSADFLVVMESLGSKLVKLEYQLGNQLEQLRFSENHNQEQALRISRQAEQIKEKSDQVNAKDIYINTLETENSAMKQTRAWRAAEFLRNTIYYRLVDSKALLKKSIRTIRQEGYQQFWRKARQAMNTGADVATLGLRREDYDLWIRHHRLTDHDIMEIKNNINGFRVKPLISIVVPVYNVDQIWLEKAIDSVRNQLYENWELCLCDDCSPKNHVREVLERYARLDKRIKIILKEKNEGIAVTSNAAFSLATGEYVGLLDHDDELSIDALYENVKVINEEPGVGLIYSDEDKMDMQGNRVDAFFKPDFSPELICSQNYICHFSVIDKSILDDIGGFREGFDGSQDHDLVLRVIEKVKKVHHIPKVLYHWRKIPGSTAAIYDSKSYAWEAGRKAVEEFVVRSGVSGSVSFGRYQGSYRVRKEIVDKPLVSVIIPFKDKSDLLKTCISSILEKSIYKNFEILGVSNNSTEKKTFILMSALSEQDKRIRFVEYNVPFNFADICNHAVELAKGDYVVLLNNDTEVISPEWLESLLEQAQSPEIGAVGGKLYYPDYRVQHAGIVIGMAGVAGHPHHFFHKDDVGYYARPHVIHNVSAVTGACMMVKKELYLAVGGMDSEKFAIAYNDVDFCLKLLNKGYRNVFTPYCEMFHYESLSRGYEDTPEKLERLQRESDAFSRKWQAFMDKGDPYYSPHLTLNGENFAIRL